jgi:hypothetical protein
VGTAAGKSKGNKQSGETTSRKPLRKSKRHYQDGNPAPYKPRFCRQEPNEPKRADASGEEESQEDEMDRKWRIRAADIFVWDLDVVQLAGGLEAQDGPF